MYLYAQNYLLPYFPSIPADFDMKSIVIDQDIQYIQPVSNMDISTCEIKLLPSRFALDLYIGYISSSINIEELCDLVIVFINDISISKYLILEILKKHIKSTGLETYTWLRNIDKVEYSHYMFLLRNWPYSNRKTEEVRKIGVAIEIIRNSYPGETIDTNGNVYGSREENDIKYKEWLSSAKLITNIGMYEIPDIKSINNESQYTPKIIEKICTIFSLFERDDLIMLCICTLMTTRKYYHTVINNVFILNLLNSLMKKHIILYKIVKYTLSYSIYMMVKEERILGKNITDDSRCILTGEVMRALPIFNENEPYMVDINDTTNRKYIPLHLIGKRRITTAEEFKNRLSLITNTMLDGIDLKKYDASITGSVIVPCVAISPLEDNYENNDFLSFVNDYYLPLSSIEPHLSSFEELEKKRYSHLDTLSHDERNEAEENYFNFLKNIPTTYQNMEEEIYATYYKAEKEYVSDIDIGIRALSMNDYTIKVVSIFREIENNLQTLLGRKPIIRLCKQPMVFGYKLVMRGKDAVRPIDFFKINISNPTLMTRFHYPIVKFWWDGITLRGLASGVCAAITGVNLFYKHFNNGKDPIQIALKYMQRGYTIVLNSAEFLALKKYIYIIPRYDYIARKTLIGRISNKHILFGNEGGIRYCLNYQHKKHDNNIQKITKQIFRSSRLGIKFIFSHNGHVCNPKIYALESAINDLMDD